MKFLLIGVMLCFLGCAEEPNFPLAQTAFDYHGLDELTYSNWLEILGDDEAIVDYLLEVDGCYEDCLDSGADDSITMSPLNPEPCVCVFR